jgi:hypothetical protein
MKYSPALAFLLAMITIAVGTIPLAARASDGEISFLAEISDKNGHPGEVCDTWDIKWRNASDSGSPAYGSCVAPVINVYAELTGASANGITGVEFAAQIGDDRFADPGYILVEIPNSDATTVLGRAFTPPDPRPRGMNMVWDACQTGGGTGRVLIETVLVFPTAPCGPSQNPPKLHITAGGHNTPSNIFFRCPLVTICDAPVFTKVCLGTNIVPCQTQVPPFCPNCSRCSTTGQFIINGAGGVGHCFVPKAEGTGGAAATTVNWSQLKALYR